MTIAKSTPHIFLIFQETIGVKTERNGSFGWMKTIALAPEPQYVKLNNNFVLVRDQGWSANVERSILLCAGATGSLTIQKKSGAMPLARLQPTGHSQFDPSHRWPIRSGPSPKASLIHSVYHGLGLKDHWHARPVPLG